MIKIENLEKSYGVLKVLKDINVKIDKGDIFGLVGISGAGKSTLLRCINGLEDYDYGSLRVKDIEVKNLKEKEIREFRKDIGMIFQNFSLIERKTVFQNIALPMEMWKYEKKYIKNKVEDLMELVGLSDKKNSMPRELSGGQKQRVAIARALTMEPSILLCDEATSALDPNITNSILSLLNRINKEFGITIVIVTHQMEVVKSICNKMAILSNGELIEKGDVVDIFLKKSEALLNITGAGSEVSLPKSGINIEIVSRLKDENKSLLYNMVKNLDVKFELISSNTNVFRDSIVTNYILNIDIENIIEVEDYLKREGLSYREVN